MSNQFHSRKSRAEGQALIETALIVPLLLVIVLNVFNLGYLFLVALNLAAAPRSGVMYSTLGFASPGEPSLAEAPKGASPSSKQLSVAYLTYQDLIGAIHSPQSNASLQVCTESLGLGANGNSRCVTCSSFSGLCSAPADSPGGIAYQDPESPFFVLNRVDTTYTFTPLIPGFAFNLYMRVIPLCGTSGNCTFHRQVSMRVMN